MSAPIDSTRFALELVKKLYRPGQNLVFSPYSLTSGLVMLLAGADDNTRTELLKVMFGEQAPNCSDRSDYDKLVKALAEANKDILARYGSALKVANLLYSDQSIQLNANYLSTLTEQMNATGKRLDLVDNQQVAVKVINSDVSDATSGLIASAIDQIEKNSALILVNAIYFKDIWQFPFDKKLTTENGEFHTLSGKVVKTGLMHKRSVSIKYYQGDDRFDKTGAKAVQLDYHGKSNISMVIILTKEGVPIDTYLKTQLTAILLDRIVEFLRRDHQGYDVTLTLPRFKLTSSHELKKPLTELGVRDTFDETKANFTGISNHDPRPLCVSQIVQKVVIEVNEEGTKGPVSVSGTKAFEYSIGQWSFSQEVEFCANRPFLFALVTKDWPPRVLFIGVVEDPAKS